MIMISVFALAASINSGDGMDLINNPTSSPTEVWVDDDFNPSTPGWGVDHFDIIQDGVDAVAGGGTVHVYAGKYYENVEIDKALNMEGEDRETTIIDGGGAGNVVFIKANSVNVTGFSVFNGSNGITLYSSNNKIEGNKVFRNGADGIFLWSSSNNKITNNNLSNNGIYGSYQGNGLSLYSSDNNLIVNNLASSNEWIGILLNDSRGNHVTGTNAISNKGFGIVLSYSSGNNVTSNFLRNEVGISLSHSSNNTITNNDASGIDGLGLRSSSNNRIINNNLSSNGRWALNLWGSSYNIIEDNILSGSKYSCWLGIGLYQSSNLNIVKGNTVSDYDYGFYIIRSSNNTIYHNNIIDNTIQAEDYNPYANFWHHPGLLEGNYWSNYTGVDNGSGTGKHAIAGDGIGDTLIPHPTTDYDFYPFIYPNGWLFKQPVANANGPYSGFEGSAISFDASLSYDPDGDPLQYRWDFDNDGIWDTNWSSSPFENYTWSDNYFGDVILEVTDGVFTDSENTTVSVYNVAPTIIKFGPFFGNEPYLVDITTDSTDPGSDDLTFKWEFEYGPTITNIFFNDGASPDPYPSAIGGTYPFIATDSVSHEYGDNGNYSVTLTVTDDDGAVAEYITYVIVDNVAPTIEKVEAYILVDFTLRAAGEKWHNVEMVIYANDAIIGNTEVTRYPGSPDDQSETIYNIKCDVTQYIKITVLYTPKDDPINGQPNGATPVWVIIDFEDGKDERLHHTCNVKHPETWEWSFGANQYFVDHEITYEATASDQGTDDLTFSWDFGVGGIDIHTVYNDGSNPDPIQSPWGTYPFTATDARTHTYSIAGSYTFKLTVTDDDGGAVDVMIDITLS
ncbi:MAG: right-handed parallel beta-helix repeat-containing protein [Thermoplasmata archaeon]|nr:MAG: right-handed parallel beta-helix repeat-containing protein [Thermoplasmata archaeon]